MYPAVGKTDIGICLYVNGKHLSHIKTSLCMGRRFRRPIVLGLDRKKMSEGKELIRYFCMPCRPTKANGGRTPPMPNQLFLFSRRQRCMQTAGFQMHPMPHIYVPRTRNRPQDAPEKWELFKKYCIRDVDVEMQIRQKLVKFPIPDREQELYCLDQRINDSEAVCPGIQTCPSPHTFSRMFLTLQAAASSSPKPRHPASLACQYGGAEGALTSMGALNYVKESELKGLVQSWRSANPSFASHPITRASIAEKSLTINLQPGLAINVVRMSSDNTSGMESYRISKR